METDPRIERKDIDKAPYVEIVAAPRYYIGLPMIIAVTWSNESSLAVFLRLPPLDLDFTRGGHISISLKPTDGRGTAVDTGFAPGEDEQKVAVLGAREKRRMVCDLSNLSVPFQPGRYLLTLTLHGPGTSRASNAVPIELVALSDADAREAARLRALGGAPPVVTAWAPFLSSNWNTVEVAPTFDPHAREALALHLFLHRATWTPAHLRDVDPKPLDAIRGPNLDAEVGALKYELAVARHDPHAKTERATLLALFPGLAHRLDEADHGKGALAAARKGWGVESSFIKPPAHWPYRP